MNLFSKWFAGKQEQGIRPALRSLFFDTTGWQESEVSEKHIKWAKSETGATLSLYILGNLDVPSGHDAMIGLCRKIAETSEGGLVSVERIQLGPKTAIN